MSEEKKCIYDPLVELMEYYADKKEDIKDITPNENLTIEEKLKSRIIDGNKTGIDKDLEIGLKKYSAIEIINDILLDGMKVVGELFGSGEMQLPFVLQSAECMKTAVSFLEPYMEKSDSAANKGTIVLATVKGDVHDIGKNLVDIILTNNGYKVINLGIKCPLEGMLIEFEKNNADAIGMSGLLVKSTAIMRENLETMNERNIQVPVILGGAALNRRFVEGELREMYRGDVYYANDAFDGLKYMESIMEHKRNGLKPVLKIWKGKESAVRSQESAVSGKELGTGIQKTETKIQKSIDRSQLISENKIPTPPFLGSRIVEDISLEEVYKYINEVALFRGSWNIYKDRKKPDEVYEKLIEEEIRPKFEDLKSFALKKKLLTPKVIYGYYHCQSEGDEVIIYKLKSENLKEQNKEYIIQNSEERGDYINSEKMQEWVRIKFPRQKKGKYLCISDYFASKESDVMDVIGLQIVTVGRYATEYAQKLYSENRYQDYLYFHGFAVETAEALAEYWHKKMREELGIASKDSNDIKKLFQQGYQGSRYSFGYPACPDLEGNKYIFELLKPERIGIELTEEWQMVPEQTTNAIIVHREGARYFLV